MSNPLADGKEYAKIYICEVQNAFVIKVLTDSPCSLKMQRLEFKEQLKKTSYTKKYCILTFTHDVNTEVFCNNFKGFLKLDLLNFISNDHYAISKSNLAKWVAYFLNQVVEGKAISTGFLNLHSNLDGFIDKELEDKCLQVSRFRNDQIDKDIKARYEKVIPKIRDWFSKQSNIEELEGLVERVYLSKTHKVSEGLFDFSARKYKDLISKYSNSNELLFPGSYLMNGIGSFGYFHYYGTLFVAHHRIIQGAVGWGEPCFDEQQGEHLERWRKIDNCVESAVRNKRGIAHIFDLGQMHGYLNNGDLIQCAPMADLIPGGLHLFKSSLNQGLKSHIEKYYPSIKFTVIDDQ